ncbi:ABC transporter G family member [Arachis hypogaea]|nr:ABC transporter G family member [Arachis hypogaea]
MYCAFCRSASELALGAVNSEVLLGSEEEAKKKIYSVSTTWRPHFRRAFLQNSSTLLFLDEPTRGLDSAASYYVMKRIKSLDHKDVIQRTVIASIHQPSAEVFQFFDNLCLLSAGKTVYFGPASAAIQSVCTILTMIATLPVAQLFFFHILLVEKGISTYDYIIALTEQEQSNKELVWDLNIVKKPIVKAMLRGASCCSSGVIQGPSFLRIDDLCYWNSSSVPSCIVYDEGNDERDLQLPLCKQKAALPNTRGSTNDMVLILEPAIRKVVQLCVLKGDFESEDWTVEEFNSNIESPRERKGSLLKGDTAIIFKNISGWRCFVPSDSLLSYCLHSIIHTPFHGKLYVGHHRCQWLLPVLSDPVILLRLSLRPTLASLKFVTVIPFRILLGIPQTRSRLFGSQEWPPIILAYTTKTPIFQNGGKEINAQSKVERKWLSGTRS